MIKCKISSKTFEIISHDEPDHFPVFKNFSDAISGQKNEFRTNYHKLSCLKQHKHVNSQFCSQKSQQADCCRIYKAKVKVLAGLGFKGNFASKNIQVVSRILAAFSGWSSCWLLSRDSQFLTKTCIPGCFALSIFKLEGCFVLLLLWVSNFSSAEVLLAPAD